MSRTVAVLVFVLMLGGSLAPPATAQVGRAALGAGVGVVGGAVVTLSAIVARARLQRSYIESAHDLIHWESIPMVAAPAAGIIFGLAGHDAQVGSIVGSTTGMAAGAVVGSLLGWMGSDEPEWPWAGGVIGAGVGLTIGGLTGGLLAWSRDDDAGIEFPSALRFGMSVPAP